MTDAVTELIDAGGDITATLTVPERARLQECEEIIEKNIRGFLATGHALAEIRDRRLYRGEFKTFERYCKQIWDIAKTTANRQIAGYETIQNLIAQKMTPMGVKNDELEMTPIGVKNEDSEMSTMVDKIEVDPTTALGALVEIAEKDLAGEVKRAWGIADMSADDKSRVILPQNERQTRPLTKLSPDDQIKAWEIVLEQLNQGKKLTSYLIGQAVKEIKGERAKKKVEKKKENLQATRLVSKIFATQYQVLLDIVVAEKKAGWKQTSKKEVIKHLNEMIDIAEMEDL